MVKYAVSGGKEKFIYFGCEIWQIEK